MGADGPAQRSKWEGRAGAFRIGGLVLLGPLVAALHVAVFGLLLVTATLLFAVYPMELMLAVGVPHVLCRSFIPWLLLSSASAPCSQKCRAFSSGKWGYPPSTAGSESPSTQSRRQSATAQHVRRPAAQTAPYDPTTCSHARRTPGCLPGRSRAIR